MQCVEHYGTSPCTPGMYVREPGVIIDSLILSTASFSFDSGQNEEDLQLFCVYFILKKSDMCMQTFSNSLKWWKVEKKYPVIGYDCQVVTEVQTLWFGFSSDTVAPLLLICNVGKAGSDENFSVKENSDEKQLKGWKCYTFPAEWRHQSLL